MKTQMKFQKILTLVCLIFAAAAIVYSFLFCSGMLYEIKFYNTNQYFVDGAKELYDYSQAANDMLVIMSIVLLLCVVLVIISAANKRRNYYITNYIAIGVLVAFSIACAIFFLIVAFKTLSLCAAVDVETWKEMYEFGQDIGLDELYHPYPQHFSTNIVTPIVGIVFAIGMLGMAAAWIYNVIWKVLLMKGEKALLNRNVVASNEEVEVA
ncbi:MAG: hypothetical protein ACI4VK_04855 [Candidatus Coproplasma sp.]